MSKNNNETKSEHERSVEKITKLQAKSILFNNSTREFFKKEIKKGFDLSDNEVDTIIDKLKSINSNSIDTSIIEKINDMFSEKAKIDYKNIKGGN